MVRLRPLFIVFPILFLGILSSMVACAQIRYDGLYRSMQPDSVSSYLRFYSDGLVIQVSAIGKPEDIQKWFSRGAPHVSVGRVTIDDDQLSFSAVSPAGRVDYNGEIDGERLHLHCYSHRNTRRGEEVYLFLHGDTLRRWESFSSERDWKSACEVNDIAGFEFFLRHHDGSEHVDEAKMRLEVLYSERDWKSTAEIDDITSCKDFLSRHPGSQYINRARARLQLLEEHLGGWQDVQKVQSLQAYKEYVARTPQSPYAGRAKSIVLDMEGRELVDLLEADKIEAAATGNSIKSVNLSVRRMTPYEITVLVPPGTFFLSHNTSSQNMVATDSYKLTLAHGNWVSLSVSVACANRTRTIPGGGEKFTIQRSPQQEELAKLIPFLYRARASFATQQAAVWIVTDDADYDDLGILVTSQFGLPIGGRVIGSQDIAKAMTICDDAGIVLTQKAIWRDRSEIVQGLEDGPLKAWLEQEGRQK